MSERRVTLEGPVNWRDLGGYPAMDGATTRWGRLFRSDSVHTLTAADIPVLRELGVRTAIDFRSAQELEQLGIGPLGDVRVTHVHVPTFDHQPGQRPPTIVLSSAVDFYTSMIESGAHAYVAAANAIAEDDRLPAVFYCVAGKDRTGIFAAIVLGLLGVPDDVVVADYAMTHEVISTITARRIERDGGSAASRDRWVDVPEELMGAHAHVMEGLIHRVREKWGGWDEYAASVGFPPETVTALRALLLDA
jgi:protein-tyrosine phosphatase